jgi:hypothetical protein
LPLIPSACSIKNKTPNEKFSSQFSQKNNNNNNKQEKKLWRFRDYHYPKKKERKGPSGHIQSACGLHEPPSCACARSGQGDSHSSSCEGLCNLLAANPKKKRQQQSVKQRVSE